MQVKDNQQDLRSAMRQVAERRVPVDVVETWEPTKRSRAEMRRAEVFNAPEQALPQDWRPWIKSIVRLTRLTQTRRSKDGQWTTRREVAFYACSKPISATEAADAIRKHWHIENRDHYVRDVAMGEDKSRIRSNPGVFSCFRSWAINMLRINGETNIEDALWRNALDFKRIQKYQLM